MKTVFIRLLAAFFILCSNTLFSQQPHIVDIPGTTNSKYVFIVGDNEFCYHDDDLLSVGFEGQDPKSRSFIDWDRIRSYVPMGATVSDAKFFITWSGPGSSNAQLDFKSFSWGTESCLDIFHNIGTGTLWGTRTASTTEYSFPELIVAVQNCLNDYIPNSVYIGIKNQDESDINKYVYYSGNVTLRVSYFDSDVNVTQVDEQGSPFGTIGKWNGGSFDIESVPLYLNLNLGDPIGLKSDQNFKQGTNQKYWEWTQNSEVNIPNPHYFTAQAGSNELISTFKSSNEGITIKNSLEGTTVTGGNVKFADPWFIDYADPNFGNQLRNRGMDDALFYQRTSPFCPDYNTPYSGKTYKGVFLNQDPAQTPTYYSVQAISPQNINLGGSIGTRRFYFQSWSYDPNKITLETPGSNQTAVVFKSIDAELVANLKGTQLSDNANGFKSNSQRKFIRSEDGTLHHVYESQGHVWYETSTNSGVTWKLENNAQPLDNGEGKQSSIDYSSWSSGGINYNDIFIVFQEKYGSGSKVKIKYFWRIAEDSPYQYRYQADIAIVSGSYSSTNTKPVIGSYAGNFTVVWKNGTSNLYARNGSVNIYYIQLYSSNSLTGTTANSVNPTIYSSKSCCTWIKHLAWEETISSSSSSIKYATLSGSQISGSIATVSDGDGYTKNYSPSIIELNGGARIVWIGRRVSGGGGGSSKINSNQGIDALVDVDQVIFKSPTYYRFWVFGTDVNSPNINKVDNNTGYVFGWSQSYAGGLVNKFADQTLSTIKTIPNVSGSDIQISNGSSKSNMYGNIFNSQQLPYYFKLSENLGSIQKTNSGLVISSGREGVVYKGEGQFYFTLGDITLNDEHINFVDIPDTLAIDSRGVLNSCLVTEPFSLNDNSDFTYGVQYGITDSTAAASTMDDDDFISFKIELIDASTGELIGSFDNVTYTKENLFQYDNISYRVNTEGIDSRTVKLKLNIDDNFSPGYSLSDKYSDETVLMKTNSREISFQGSIKVESYDLAQNYPNPFNPSTTIKYQIPEDGMVTLKIYDVLGKEVKTLVNEQKPVGRYVVKFDATDLATGVYIYRLRVNDFVSVKKMVLMK